MGAAYSQDLQDRVITARDRGMKTKSVADLFSVSASWVRRVELVRANSLSLVRFDRNDYSVPVVWAHQPLTVVGDVQRFGRWLRRRSPRQTAWIACF